MNRLCGARGYALGILALAGISFGTWPVFAQAATLTVELNKLEPQGSGCRAYIVVKNDDATAYEAFKLDIVIFQKDDVIARRFAMDIAPIKPQKRTVKLFELDELACDNIGSILINEIVECKGETDPIEDCLGRLTVKSLTDVQLMK